ncbi:MAG: hypothetical protein ACTJHL_08495 [Neisseriaceae bacterium]
MAIALINEGYTVFPYPAGYDDDESNIGGIDLLQAPERSVEIPETAGLYYLPSLLQSLNQPEAETLTLGCGFWQDQGVYYSYLEFAWRDAEAMPDVNRLDEAFLDWAVAHCEEFDNIYGIIKANTEWGRRSVQHQGLGREVMLLEFLVCGLTVYEVEYVYQALGLFLDQLQAAQR